MSFEEDVIIRHAMVLASHPIHSKRDLPPRMTERIIPVHEKIASLLEARDCYLERVRAINHELKIYREDQ